MRTRVLGLLFVALLAPASLNATTSSWTSAQDPALGFTYSYPPSLFSPVEGDGKPSFHYFESDASQAKSWLVPGATLLVSPRKNSNDGSWKMLVDMTS